MQKTLSVVWFRNDLRISDNPALLAASNQGPLFPVYIFDDSAPQDFKMGSATKIWLHHSLDQLNTSLHGCLNRYCGEAPLIIEHLIRRYPIIKLFWNQCYEPWHLDQEDRIIRLCNQQSIDYEIHHGNYLYDPSQIVKKDGSCYKVFTAYKNKALSLSYRARCPTPNKLHCFQDPASLTLSDLKLLPHHPWHKHIKQTWDIGEQAAQTKLHEFMLHHLKGYYTTRNSPSQGGTSKLSPHLHFGELSPSQVLESLHSIRHANAQDKNQFIHELLWREFSCYLLYHFKQLPLEPFHRQFNRFPWTSSPDLIERWKQGCTGYPLIDAGMRELWQTGYMHNRIRMVTASFLVKNLNIHWRHGMAWFWDCLVDADLANNSVNWQWVAGSGVDAAPYFRMFNPTIQGITWDPHGDYTKKFVPELKDLPNKYLFEPWKAPPDVLDSTGVILGVTYPLPIVEWSKSRQQALDRYRSL